jgi:hypothetical protein
MYHSATAVWNGLAKNAREGMASWGQIGFWTVVLLCGQVLPFALLVWALTNQPLQFEVGYITFFATVIVLGVRGGMHERFHCDPITAFLHPIAILLLLVIQWYAIVRAVIGKPVGWKGRAVGH